MSKIIIVGGATATGKTQYALSLAKKLNGELISADSMQIYSGLDIGTAKEKNLDVFQHCIDIVDPKSEFSVVDYMKNAELAIKNIQKKGKIPMIVGGTGYYIHSLLYKFDYANGETEEYEGNLNKLYEIYESNGIEILYNKLISLDPISAEKVHKNNTRRVIKALEYVERVGKSYFSQNLEPEKKILDYAFYYLHSENREELYKKIDNRVEKMIKDGLEQEVEELLKSGVSFKMQSMQGIGYKEWNGFFEKTISLHDVILQIKKNSRHYAKRQITWFKNQYKDAITIKI